MKKRLAVIYDTSYLMADRFTDVQKLVECMVLYTCHIYPGEILSEELKKGHQNFAAEGWKVHSRKKNTDPKTRRVRSYTYYYWRFGESFFQIDNFIPSEVCKEIANHFSSAEKEQIARRARKFVASLLEQGVREIELHTLAKPHVSGHPLGADSPTDQLILGYAISLVNSNYDFVIIASEDGGILFDAIQLALAGHPVFCLNKERHTKLEEQLHIVLGDDSVTTTAR